MDGWLAGGWRWATKVRAKGRSRQHYLQSLLNYLYIMSSSWTKARRRGTHRRLRRLAWLVGWSGWLGGLWWSALR